MLRQADALRRAGRAGEAISAYQSILVREPMHVRALCGIGECYVRGGDHDRGLEFLRKGCEASDHDPRYVAMFAEALFASGEVTEAMAQAHTAMSKDPHNVQSALVLTHCYEKEHRIEGALDTIERIATTDSTPPYVSILRARLMRRADRLEDASALLHEVLKQPSLNNTMRRFALHELAMILDHTGHYDDAFDAFSAYADLTAQSPEYRAVNPARSIQVIREYREALDDPDFLQRLRNSKPIDQSQPAFLVGFPRSGTTMTEQILSAHPSITSTDETPIISWLKTELHDRVSDQSSSAQPLTDAQAIMKAPDSLLNGLRLRYWERARYDPSTHGPEARFIDKLPLNLVDLPFINVLFPAARILIALRDPRDVCLSCFQQDFGLNNAMANLITLESTTRYYEQVMGLLLQYRQHLTLPMIELRYEDTVTNLEREARRVLEFLDLEWNADVLRFHEKARERVISTPSYEAVTRSIHSKAVKRWKNYSKHFEPFLDRLQPFLEAFGYADND